MKNKELPFLLIVEDDIENQKYFRILFKNHFRFEICNNSDDCLKLINENNFDVILMDITIQGSKDGLQLTKEIKTNPLHNKIPIVVLSAHAFQKDKLNAEEAGVDCFLTKPIDGIVLRNTLLSYSQKS